MEGKRWRENEPGRAGSKGWIQVPSKLGPYSSYEMESMRSSATLVQCF